LFGRFVFGGAFFLDAAGSMPVKIHNPTAAKRFAAFTYVHGAAQQLWLCGAGHLHDFCIAECKA